MPKPKKTYLEMVKRMRQVMKNDKVLTELVNLSDEEIIKLFSQKGRMVKYKDKHGIITEIYLRPKNDSKEELQKWREQVKEYDFDATSMMPDVETEARMWEDLDESVKNYTENESEEKCLKSNKSRKP